MPRLKKRSLETKARISRMKRAEKRREQILILKTQAEEMEILCRGIRSEGALVPPIRQTASIFKQPVTVHKNQEGKVKADFKHGRQEKPRQVFWEKRLEGIRASEKDGYELGTRWTGLLRPAGPHVSDDTLLQSVATALHVCAMPVTGQPPMRSHYDKEIVYRIPDQPLVQEVSVTVEDIKSQEERVIAARKRLQEIMISVRSKNTNLPINNIAYDYKPAFLCTKLHAPLRFKYPISLRESNIVLQLYKLFHYRLTNHSNPLIYALNSANIPGNPPIRLKRNCRCRDLLTIYI
uniref:Methyl-CpG-binding domain protein 2 n=2 Tax=Aphidinae TaxID=133076 RepID=A0A2S2PAH8_SCHGA